MSASSSIMVTVRVRPFSIREAAQVVKLDDTPTFFGDGSLASTPTPKITGKGIRRVVKVVDDRMLIFDPPEDNPMARFQKTLLPQGKRVKDMKFGFDRVFDENVTQQEVYEATTRGLLDNILDGFNATVFAYGATGCGKTHTISGNPQNPGIILLTMKELYARINELNETKEVSMSLSYLEIYNETIRDLLIEGGSTKGLALREDSNQGISVAGLTQFVPRTAEEVMDMIMRGNANRTMSPTEANATSSRSHAVLQINVSQKEAGSGALSQNHISATLSIIDLAGSERASVTKNRGERLLEGANINRSLLALGNCINALCDPGRRSHVPYRDSKLTRLLKFSLGGNCKTVMIVCVSPSSQHYDETHNTLKYANRAKNIKTKVSRNMINVDRHVGQYVARIFELTNEVERLKKRLEDTTKEAMDKLSKQINQRDASLKDGQRRLKAAYENSKDLRDTRIRDYKNLRLIDRRIALVGAWQVAFDDVFASADPEILPKSLFAIRSEAEKVLSDLENNRLGLNYRLAGTSPDREVEKTLEVTVRNLKAIEGYTEQDVDTLHKDASLYKIMIDRDLFHSMAEADIDATTSVQTLSRALFQSIAVLSQIDIQDESSIEATHKTLFETIQTCTDATSHIIKPNGERVSTMEYPTMSFESPRKKKHVMMDPSSPIRGPFAQPVNGEAPYRPSPRAFKVGTPKKAIQFKKKSPRKKRVRWQDETETEDLVEEESKRSRFETFVAEPPAPSQSIFSDYAPARQPLEHPADLPPLDIPPVRPRNNRMQMGFLSKDGQTSPQKNSNNNQYLHTERRAFSGSTLSPLREHQMSDLLNQQPKEHDHDESSADEHIGKPWQVNLNPKSSMKSRRVSSGSGPPQRPRRRMPSLSGNHMAPDNHMATFRPGHARRMILSKSEKENGVSVLSPKATALKSAPRRITLSGPGGRRMSSAAVFERAAIKTAGRESIAGGSKPTWR